MRRVLSPVLILIFVNLCTLFFSGLLLAAVDSGDFNRDVYRDVYSGSVLWLTTAVNVIVIFLLRRMYKKDEALRVEWKIIPSEKQFIQMKDVAFLLFIGGGFSIVLNLILNLFGTFIPKEDYANQMAILKNGKTTLELIFHMGIVAPAAEEMIYRWMLYLRMRDYIPKYMAIILSSLIFGAMHGNWLQFVYASLLGMIMALFLEWTGCLWSCVLIHAGANIASLLVSSYAEKLVLGLGEMGFLVFVLLCLLIALTGISYYRREGTENTGKQRDGNRKI